MYVLETALQWATLVYPATVEYKFQSILTDNFLLALTSQKRQR